MMEYEETTFEEEIIVQTAETTMGFFPSEPELEFQQTEPPIETTIEIIPEDVETEAIDIYSELTSEFIVIDTDEVETETGSPEETTSSTETNYLEEIYKNTKTSADCLSYLAGVSIIAIAIFICVVIAKVFLF